ncbi:MAG: DMT family transporter [Planctomycetes bacterium]|nr:DMT family transporter [Planctomycetota bacterium]
MIKTYTKLMLTMIFWGGTFISGRLLAGHVSPFTTAFLRFATAGTILLIVLYRRNGSLPAVPRHLLMPIFCLGLTGVFSYNVLFFSGLQSVAAGRASVIIANNPVFISMFAALIFRERLGWIKAAGVMISVSGAVIAISGGDMAVVVSGGLGWGDLMIFGCVISWVAFSLIGKIVVAHVAPLTAISYAATVGAVLLFFPAVMDGMFGALETLTLFDWCNIAYLGIFGTVLGFVWYYEGIERIGATRAGLFINFVPISAIIMAFFLLDEPITASLLIGTALVLSGVYLTNNGLPHLRKLTGI